LFGSNSSWCGAEALVVFKAPELRLQLSAVNDMY